MAMAVKEIAPLAGASLGRKRRIFAKKRGQLTIPLNDPQVGCEPFLKWAGGKRALLEQIIPLLPDDVRERKYFEPFLGGGALFFALQPRNAILSDSNPHLIETYIVVRDEVENLLDALDDYRNGNDKATYERVRAQQPRDLDTSVARAARFIYLNKTCYNGLYRVNKKGEFNTPFGKYAKPVIQDVDGLRLASAALQWAEIFTANHSALIVQARARAGDFVYYDPPYVPASSTADFTGYTADGFGAEEQRTLATYFDLLARTGCYAALSNADTPFVRELYSRFWVHEIQARRNINSAGDGRGAVGEVLVTNYGVADQPQEEGD